jgi:hypothetical protein
MSELLRVFYDCEFTDLVPDAALISVGFVCGSEALYVELTDGWEAEQCSYFVEERVLPLLGKHTPERLGCDAAAIRIQEWLDALRAGDKSRKIIIMLSDSVWDWEMLKTLFWDIDPTPWARREHVVGRLVQKQFPEIQYQLETISDKGFEDQHHALVDALQLQSSVQALLSEQHATCSTAETPTDAETLLETSSGKAVLSEDDELLVGRNKLLSEIEDWK